MNWTKFVRQSHRWLSVVFTLTVIANLVALAVGKYSLTVAYLPLLPLVLQLVTGLFLFVAPYTIKWRSRRRTAAEAG
jgi:hypothetical protein